MNMHFFLLHVLDAFIGKIGGEEGFEGCTRGGIVETFWVAGREEG